MNIVAPIMAKPSGKATNQVKKRQPGTIQKYSIEYTLFPRHNDRVLIYQTTDSIEAECFIMHLLASGGRLFDIRLNGERLEPHEFDRLLLVAAESLMIILLEETLQIDNPTTRRRFRFSE